MNRIIKRDDKNRSNESKLKLRIVKQENALDKILLLLNTEANTLAFFNPPTLLVVSIYRNLIGKVFNEIEKILNLLRLSNNYIYK